MTSARVSCPRAAAMRARARAAMSGPASVAARKADSKLSAYKRRSARYLWSALVSVAPKFLRMSASVEGSRSLSRHKARMILAPSSERPVAFAARAAAITPADNFQSNRFRRRKRHVQEHDNVPALFRAIKTNPLRSKSANVER